VGQEDRVSSDGAAIARQEDPGVGGDRVDFDPGYHGVSVECGIYACTCDCVGGECAGLRRYEYSVSRGTCYLCGQDHRVSSEGA